MRSRAWYGNTRFHPIPGHFRSAPRHDVLHTRFDVSAWIMTYHSRGCLARSAHAQHDRMPSNRTLRTYDHRLIHFVQETGDAELATRLGVPKSTASGWIRRSPRAVITASGLDESAVALRIRVARLEKRVRRLGAMVRILLALFRILQSDLKRLRVPNGSDKRLLLRAVDRSRGVLGLRRVLKAIGLSLVAPWRLAARGSGLRTGGPVLVPVPVAARPYPEGGLGDRRHGHFARLPTRPHRETCLPRSVNGQGDRLAVHPVSAGAGARVAPSPPSLPSGKAAHGDPRHEAERNVAHRCDGPPPARRKPRVPARGNRQLLSAHPVVVPEPCFRRGVFRHSADRGWHPSVGRGRPAHAPRRRRRRGLQRIGGRGGRIRTPEARARPDGDLLFKVLDRGLVVRNQTWLALPQQPRLGGQGPRPCSASRPSAHSVRVVDARIPRLLRPTVFTSALGGDNMQA